MVACLREIFLSVRQTSTSAAEPITFLPMRRMKSSSLCWPLSATSQPQIGVFLPEPAPRPRLRSAPPPPIWSTLTITVPAPDGAPIIISPPPPPPPAKAIPPPPPPCCRIISCCICWQYGHMSHDGSITFPFGQTRPADFLLRPLKSSRTSRKTCRNISNASYPLCPAPVLV